MSSLSTSNRLGLLGALILAVASTGMTARCDADARKGEHMIATDVTFTDKVMAVIPRDDATEIQFAIQAAAYNVPKGAAALLEALNDGKKKGARLEVTVRGTTIVGVRPAP